MSVGIHGYDSGAKPADPEQVLRAFDSKFIAHAGAAALVHDGIRNMQVLAGRIMAPQNASYIGSMFVLQRRVWVAGVEPSPLETVPPDIALHRSTLIVPGCQLTVEYRDGEPFYLGEDGQLVLDERGDPGRLSEGHYAQALDLTTSLVPEGIRSQVAAEKIWESGRLQPGIGTVSSMPRL